MVKNLPAKSEPAVAAVASTLSPTIPNAPRLDDREQDLFEAKKLCETSEGIIGHTCVHYFKGTRK
jgi:hypothetical protein